MMGRRAEASVANILARVFQHNSGSFFPVPPSALALLPLGYAVTASLVQSTGRRHDIDRWHPSLMPRHCRCSKGMQRRDRVVARVASWRRRRRRLSSCCRRWRTPRPSRARRGAARSRGRAPTVPRAPPDPTAHPWKAPTETTVRRARTARNMAVVSWQHGRATARCPTGTSGARQRS